MDHDLVRAIVLADALPTAFESACLVQCTDVTRSPGRRRPQWHAAPVPLSPAAAALAEFDQKDAAVRLASLLTDLGYAAGREVRTGGGRRRYDLQRVLVPEPQRAAANRMMAAAWRQGRQALLGTDPLGSSAPRHAQRVALARAAWRAALLAGGRRLRADILWVRLGDHDMAAVLVRAARLMGVTAEVTSRPGCLLVTVPAATAPVLLGIPTPADHGHPPGQRFRSAAANSSRTMPPTTAHHVAMSTCPVAGRPCRVCALRTAPSVAAS